jgi:hypothetical protein
MVEKIYAEIKNIEILSFGVGGKYRTKSLVGRRSILMKYPDSQLMNWLTTS